MGRGGRGCTQRQGVVTGTRAGLALFAGVRSHSAKRSRAFHPAAERAHRARGWLRSFVRKAFQRRIFKNATGALRDAHIQRTKGSLQGDELGSGAERSGARPIPDANKDPPERETGCESF